MIFYKVFFFQLFLFSFTPLNGCQYNLWFPWFLVKSNAILDLQCIVEYRVTNVSDEFPVNYVFWSNNKLYSMPGPLYCMYVCLWACECVLCVLDKRFSLCLMLTVHELLLFLCSICHFISESRLQKEKLPPGIAICMAYKRGRGLAEPHNGSPSLDLDEDHSFLLVRASHMARHYIN